MKSAQNKIILKGALHNTQFSAEETSCFGGAASKNFSFPSSALWCGSVHCPKENPLRTTAQDKK